MEAKRNVQGSKAYDVRLQSFKKKLDLVSKLQPDEDFLHPLMCSVPFNDMETALEMTLMALEKNSTNISW